MDKEKKIKNNEISEEQKNGYFPIFLEVKNKNCLIIGNGETAVEKANILKSFGAKPIILTEKIDDHLKKCSDIEIREKSFEPQDLKDCLLVIITDRNHPSAAEIAKICTKQGIFITIIDDFTKGNFIFPYIFQNGCITTAVSSGGKNPALAMSTKNMFETYTPEYYQVLSDSIEKYNSYLKNKVQDSKIRKKIYNELFNIGKSNHGIITEEHIQDLIKYYTK